MNLNQNFSQNISQRSPGSFYGGISVADIQADNYSSSLRNKLVAEAFYLTGNIEKYGSGYIRIRKALMDYPEIDFEIAEFCGGVMAKFTQRNGGNDLTGQVTGQVATEILGLLKMLKIEMSRQALQTAMALRSRENFDKRYLKPAIELNLIEHTIPDKPNSSQQKYRLTAAGKALLLNLKDESTSP